MAARSAKVNRKTKETDIKLSLILDGSGSAKVDTGIGFFDHMLEGFARHGLFDLEVSCKGDTHVDGHHTIEDVGIVLGDAILHAVGDKAGIKRYGQFLLPMDETLVMCAIDLCGRPYYASDLSFDADRIGDMETEMVGDFFYAISYSGAMNIHFSQIRGANNHHIAEAAFKAFAKALDMATMYEPRIEGPWSTKGTL